MLKDLQQKSPSDPNNVLTYNTWYEKYELGFAFSKAGLAYKPSFYFGARCMPIVNHNNWTGKKGNKIDKSNLINGICSKSPKLKCSIKNKN